MKTKKEIKERIKYLKNGMKVLSKSSKSYGLYLNAIVIDTLNWVLEESEEKIKE